MAPPGRGDPGRVAGDPAVSGHLCRIWRLAAVAGVGWVLSIGYAATTIDHTPKVVPMIDAHPPQPRYPQTSDT